MNTLLDVNVQPRVRRAVAQKSTSSAIDTQVWLFVLCFFIPDKLHLQVGSLSVTPLRFLALVLLPQLVLRRRFRWAIPDYLMLTFFAVMFVAYLPTGSVFRVLESTGRLFLDTGVPYLVGRYVVQDRRLLLRLLRLIVNVLAVLAVALVFESLWRLNIHQRVWGLITPVGNVYAERRLGLTRAMGWTSHPIMLGLFYASFLPVALYAAVYRTNLVGHRAWLKVGALLTGVFLSVSSTAWLAAGIVIALYLWERVRLLSVRDKWYTAFVTIPLMYIVLEALANRPLLRILMMNLHLSSPDAWYYRWILRGRVLTEMPGHWLLGHGLQTPEAFLGPVGWSIDNYYLLLLLLTGILGLASWIGFMVSVVFYRAKVVWFGPDTETARLARALRFAVIASAAAQISVALFSSAAITLWFLMGLAVGVASDEYKRSVETTYLQRVLVKRLVSR